MALAVALEQFVEGADALHPHQPIQLLAGVGEVLAQALVYCYAAGGQLVLEHLLEQGRATTAAGGGLGAALDRGKVAAAAVDGGADRALADVVARADGRAVGQGIGTQGRSAARLWQDQRGRVGRQGYTVLRVLQQGVVVAVVTHQHRAQHMLAAGIHHQPTVGGVGFVDEAVAARAWRGAMGIADRADIHAQQLELGRHVGTGEGNRGIPHQQRRQVTGHAVARRNQAEHAAVPRRALADGEDARIAGATVVVDHHPAPRGSVQPACAGQGVLRADAGGEHDQVGFQVFAAVEVHAVAIALTGTDRLGGAGQVHAHAQGLDLCLERRTALAVQLHRHQAWGKLHHMRFQAQGLECIGRLQAQQAATHHHATLGIAGGGADCIEVVEGAVDQAGVAAGPFDRRDERVGAGGQYQLVVRVAALGGNHLAARAVDLHHRFAQVQVHALAGVETLLAHRQGLGAAAAEVFGEVHTVVGTLAFFTEHPHLEVLQGATLDQLLDAVVADHAVADNHQLLSLPAVRCCRHSRSSIKKKRLERKLQAPLPVLIRVCPWLIAVDQWGVL
ncbi:hypothetical protein D3C76_507730 [compost metagenome]